MEEGLDTKMVKSSADYVKAMESNVQSNQVTRMSMKWEPICNLM